MPIFYEFAFGGFPMNAESGIFIDNCAIAPGWKQAKAEVEGRAGGYLGEGHEGFVIVTVSGKVKGDSGIDLRLKQRAFLTALKSAPSGGAPLVVDSVTSFAEAVPQGLPTFTDTVNMLFCTDFAVVFIAQPE